MIKQSFGIIMINIFHDSVIYINPKILTLDNFNFSKTLTGYTGNYNIYLPKQVFHLKNVLESNFSASSEMDSDGGPSFIEVVINFFSGKKRKVHKPVENEEVVLRKYRERINEYRCVVFDFTAVGFLKLAQLKDKMSSSGL